MAPLGGFLALVGGGPWQGVGPWSGKGLGQGAYCWGSLTQGSWPVLGSLGLGGPWPGPLADRPGGFLLWLGIFGGLARGPPLARPLALGPGGSLARGALGPGGPSLGPGPLGPEPWPGGLGAGALGLGGPWGSLARGALGPGGPWRGGGPWPGARRGPYLLGGLRRVLRC